MYMPKHRCVVVGCYDGSVTGLDVATGEGLCHNSYSSDLL